MAIKYMYNVVFYKNLVGISKSPPSLNNKGLDLGVLMRVLRILADLL